MLDKVEQVMSDKVREGRQDPEAEVVILLAAHKKAHISNLANAIKQDDPASWTEDRRVGQLRIHSHQNPLRKIIETTPLDYVPQRSSTVVASMWISQNSLRRVIVNKFVVVVCVITLEVLKEYCLPSAFEYDKWVDVLSVIFRDQKEGVLFVVKHDRELGSSVRGRIKTFITKQKFSPEKVIYSGFDEVRNVLAKSIGLSSNSAGITVGPVVSPFCIKARSSMERTCTIWSPEKVIVFGRTGSGKSTLAQMLTTGKLDSYSEKFDISSSIRGHTMTIDSADGRGWNVVDSPGLGQHRAGAVPSDEAQRLLKKYVSKIDGTYAHYLYVVKRDRMDQLEINMWKFFKALFAVEDLVGRDAFAHISIVFSNASKMWVEENIEYLQRTFEGCRSFLPVEFPFCVEEDVEFTDEISDELFEELQKENDAVQQESLEHLEEELAKLGRYNRTCRYGKDSKTSRAIDRDRTKSDLRVQRFIGERMIVRILKLGSNLLCRTTVKDRIVLEPLII